MVIKLTINGKEISRTLVDSSVETYVGYSKIKICSVCYDLYGFWNYNDDPTVFYQKCDCQPKKGDIKWETKWGVFDFNEVVTLCYCCGQELLKSGSKFSVWFCDECKKRIMEFNSQFKMAIIPIGRHSFMAGIMVKHEDLQNQEIRTQFCNAIVALFDRMKILYNWKEHIMQGNFRTLGLTEDVLITEYLSTRDLLPSKDEAAKGMFEFFEKNLTGEN